MIDSNVISQRYELLSKIHELYKSYNSLDGVKQISITDFESHYGELLVAKKIIDAGFSIESLNKEGCDIKVNGKRIEVKTSRLQKRVSKSKKKGYGWVVKEAQWKEKKFNMLVCIALNFDENGHRIFTLTYDEVLKFFSKCAWTYEKYNKNVKNWLRLDLFPDGVEALMEDDEIKRKTINLSGSPTEFEVYFNKNPSEVFKKYNFERLINLIGQPISSSNKKPF